MLLSPANLAPLAGRRNVVVIHDSAPFRQPSWYGRAYGAWHRTLTPRIARHARLVIAPSEHVRAELTELFSLAPDRVVAIAPGVDPSFASPGDPAPLLGRLGLSGRTSSRSAPKPAQEPRPARRDRPAACRAGLDVAIAGSTRPYMPSSSAAGARRLGYVEDADLPALYAGAAAFAMPSLYEGFGLPCVEAMAAGTPVVAADRAALPEACGGAALLADPDDTDGFASALLDAAGPERERLVAAGRERAATLTWQRTAEDVDRALEPLLRYWQTPVTVLVQPW